METDDFETIVAEELDAVPEKYKNKLKNIAIVIEEEPSDELLAEEGIEEGGTLLGLYRGIPLTERGGSYGVGITMPDSITLFKKPILEEGSRDSRGVRFVVRETIWHEIAHYFGYDEPRVEERERHGSNLYEP